ncbi:MAG: cupin domain-containing protein [Roseiflexus castenholzii]|uniref:cupin domain-containing protein n=1 Tax=Roseiflexus castenholzii TaxID=120962 RepID=UPI000CB30F08|nr:MAG: cupin domain-containing protein [Roseiflexus castenholzii]
MTEPQQERWFEVAPGIRRRTIAVTGRMQQILVELDQGARLPEHRHPHEQITHLISGRLRFFIEGKVREVTPGDTVALPGNMPHGVEALEASLAIDTFSPPREDMLAQDAAP